MRYVAREIGSGNPMLMIHGLGCSIESWINMTSKKCDKGLRVIALDLPGFGLSDKPRMNYTIKFCCKFITNLWQCYR